MDKAPGNGITQPQFWWRGDYKILGRAGNVSMWQSGGQGDIAMGPRGEEQLKVLGNAGAWRPWVLRMSRQERGPEGAILIPRRRSHHEEIIVWEQHGQSCLAGSSQGSHGLPSHPQQPSCHLLYYCTSHGHRVLKFFLLCRLHVIQNKVMTCKEIHDHRSVCQPEPLIAKGTSVATLS